MITLIEIFSALLTPFVAVIGIVYVIKTYQLDKRKRQDELFDRRYKFLKDFEKLWKTTGSESLGFTKMELEWDDIEPWAQEASYLFGQDIVDHITSYKGKSYNEPMSWIPDYDLSKPFDKYLRFNQ